MSDVIKIEGSVENIIYKNEDNSYVVFSICLLEKSKSEITCIGYIPNLIVGENVILTGKIIVHSSYGKQFKVELCEKTTPKTESGIEKYLASGIIKGLGKKTAEKIVKKFGKDTLNIIETNPEKLSEVKGISVKKAIEIGQIFVEQESIRKVIMYLQDYNISAIFAMKVYQHFKENTIKIIETNPYRLADEMFGIGFKIADKIAKKVRIDECSQYRVKSGIKYVLTKAANSSGDVFLPENILIQETELLLNIPEEIIVNNLHMLQINRQICIEKTETGNIVFLNLYYYAESYVAKKILQLSKTKYKYKKNYNSLIQNIEKQNKITLADKQKQAIKEAMINGVLVITGGPGTGKTTTINSIIEMFAKEDYEIKLCAPTGRAAKRMTEATNIEAKTIHRLLGMNFLESENNRHFFEKDEDMPIEADVIIVDECSMIDILLMYNFLKAVVNGTRLILVGDIDQLPSVGPGNVLKDIINSDCVKVVKLDEIFRQARESNIVINAHRINQGQYPIISESNKDFFFLKRHNVEDVNNTIIELITKRLPKFLNVKDSKTIQVLTPMRKSSIGVENLNNILQNAINPPNKDKNEKEFRNTIFREGDRIMQIKNNYNIPWKMIVNNICVDEGTGVFNGDEGVILKIDNDREFIDVVFDECRYVQYDFKQLDEISLSYAITVHKSQGSEYKAIIMVVHSGSPMLLTRNLLYTGVTRAKDFAIIVGIEETLKKMVDNNSEINRYTYLKDRIINLSKFI